MNIDASHIRADDGDIKFGRAGKGKKAMAPVFLKRADGTLVSVLAALTIDGFDLDCCRVVEGAIDYERYRDWILDDVGPTLNPYDSRRLPNSVVFW